MLQMCKILLKKLYLWPLAQSASMKVLSVVRYAVNLSIEMTVLVTTFIYVLQNLDNVEEATEPGFACFAIGTSMFIYVWMISKIQSISLVIDELEAFVNESKKKNIFFYTNFTFHAEIRDFV